MTSEADKWNRQAAELEAAAHKAKQEFEEHEQRVAEFRANLEKDHKERFTEDEKLKLEEQRKRVEALRQASEEGLKRIVQQVEKAGMEHKATIDTMYPWKRLDTASELKFDPSVARFATAQEQIAAQERYQEEYKRKNAEERAARTLTSDDIRKATQPLADKLSELNGGTKYDEGKPAYHLLPPDAIQAIAIVLEMGANKYAPRNWEKGIEWSRVYRAVLGHMFSWWMGEDDDPETKQPHLAHAACCVLFLLAFCLRKVGQDDRPEQPTPYPEG